MEEFPPMIQSSRLITDPSAWSFSAKLAIAMLSASILPVALTVSYTVPYQSLRNLLIVGAIAIVTSFLLTRLVTKPIRLLAKAAHALEKGNFAPASLVKLSGTPDNIGYLAQVFSKLAARVKATQEQAIDQSVTKVLLQELSNRDLDWLTNAGHHTEVQPGTVLIQERQPIDTFSIVLDGTLSVTTNGFKGSCLNRPLAHRQDEQHDWEICQLNSGEVMGEGLLTGGSTISTATVKALEPTLLLSLSQQQLTSKLKQDMGFAAHFYRAIAIILSNRLQTLISQLGCTSLTQDQPLRDVLFILGALNDSDIDWLVAVGKRQKVPLGKVLIQQDRPVDALYILLNGSLSVSTDATACNPFLRTFSVIDGGNPPGQEITRLSKGEIVGEATLLNAHLPPATVTALQDSLVLIIPRSQLAIKLHQDSGFAARFYKVLVSLLSNRLQDLYSRLGYGGQGELQEQPLNGAVKFEDELNFNVLDQMAIAGTRFDWILRRLGGIEPA
jgi:bacteriocin-type transport-associated protein